MYFIFSPLDITHVLGSRYVSYVYISTYARFHKYSSFKQCCRIWLLLPKSMWCKHLFNCSLFPISFLSLMQNCAYSDPGMHHIVGDVLLILYHIDFHRYYSLYGHVDTMAREVHRGAAAVEGVDATLWRVSLQSVQVCDQVKKRAFNLMCF